MMSKIKSGGVIRWARKYHGMTQEQFAKYTGGSCTQSQVAHWETERKSPRLGIRLKHREDAADEAVNEIERILNIEISDDEAAEIIAVIVDCQS